MDFYWFSVPYYRSAPWPGQLSLWPLRSLFSGCSLSPCHEDTQASIREPTEKGTKSSAPSCELAILEMDFSALVKPSDDSRRKIQLLCSLSTSAVTLIILLDQHQWRARSRPVLFFLLTFYFDLIISCKIVHRVLRTFQLPDGDILYITVVKYQRAFLVA